MKIIYHGTAYEYPVKNKDLCGVLYCRHGGAPANIIYQFTSFDQNGIKEGPEYRWYDMNENNANDEEDLFVMDDTEMGMITWLEMTDIYRENAVNASQELEWIVNKE